MGVREPQAYSPACCEVIMSYPALANLKTFVNTSSESEDGVLQICLDAAIDFVEKYTGHSFEESDSVTIKVIPEYPYILGPHRRKLLINEYDIQSVSGITNGDGESIAASDYRLLPVDGPPYFMIELAADSGLYWFSGWDRIGTVDIVCTTGYCADTGTPGDIYAAIIQLAVHLYRARSSGGGGHVRTATRGGLVIEPSDIPDSVRVVLDSYRRL